MSHDIRKFTNRPTHELYAKALCVHCARPATKASVYCEACAKAAEEMALSFQELNKAKSEKAQRS